MVKSAK